MPKVTITVPEQTPQPYRFQLDREIVTLGRGADNDIVIDSGSVSVIHAEMHRVQGGYELRDLESTNGISLDGERMEVVSLKTGGDVKLGEVSFEFALTGHEIEVLRSENTLPVAQLVSVEPSPVPKVVVKDTADEEDEEETGTGAGFGKILVLLFLVIVAFGVGLGVRYHKETGRSFLEDVRARHAAAAPAAK